MIQGVEIPRHQGIELTPGYVQGLQAPTAVLDLGICLGLERRFFEALGLGPLARGAFGVGEGASTYHPSIYGGGGCPVSRVIEGDGLPPPLVDLVRGGRDSVPDGWPMLATGVRQKPRNLCASRV